MFVGESPTAELPQQHVSLGAPGAPDIFPQMDLEQISHDPSFDIYHHLFIWNPCEVTIQSLAAATEITQPKVVQQEIHSFELSLCRKDILQENYIDNTIEKTEHNNQ